MKPKDMINQIKTLLGVEVKMAEAKLENGTIISSESFSVGDEIFIVTEDEKVAMPIGSYTLDDQREIVVEEEGVIASIGEPTEEEVETTEEVKEELAAVEPVEKVTHNPETETKTSQFLYSQKRTTNTLDRVMSKISNINK